MICANCNTPNDTGDPYCFECGSRLSMSDSQETRVIDTPGRHFNPTPAYTTPPPAAGSTNKTGLWVALAVILVAILGAGGYIFLNKTGVQEAFPDNFGFFVQNNERDRVDKIQKQETNNALQTKNDLLKNDSLPALDQNPNLVVYPDGNDIPVSDLKLVQLDTIKDDGNYKHLEIQAARIDGKPDMRRLRVPDGLANGKYAFVLMDGFLNEGKHKFWAFQVKNSSKSDNNAVLKDSSIALKPAPPPAQKVVVPGPVAPVVPPPAGTTPRTVGETRVILRNSPCLTCKDTGVRLTRGDTVYVINYSSNYDTWKNLQGNWALVQTRGGKQGWVFSPLLR